jgi:AraC-like DNA-binding protein
LDKLFSFWYDFGMKLTSIRAKMEHQKEFFDSLGEVRELLRMWDTIPHLHFFLKNKEGQFLALNRNSLLRLGMNEESDVIGKTDFDFHPRELAAAYVNEDRRVMSTGKPVVDQLWTVVNHHGIHEWFLSSKTPLRNRCGEVIGIAGVMRKVEKQGDFINLYGPLGHVVQGFLRDYSQQFSMSERAESIGMSLSSFERKFSAIFGQSPTQYLQQVRIHAARAMIERDQHELAHIARACGFYDQSQFGKVFKRFAGMTPAQYRAKMTTRSASFNTGP